MPDNEKSDTSSRKRDHVELAVGGNVTHRWKTTGFERWEFVHNALPEIDFDEITTDVEFMGKRLSMPLLITGMTGGYADAERINAGLASVCESARIAIGAGSQRQALENDQFHDSWRVLRRNAPSVPILANIGAAEVARMPDASAAQRLVDMLEADAIAVHLNPLQELLQPEGSPAFRGVLHGIGLLVRFLPVPVVVKEVGAGISVDVAARLHAAGVRWIDIAGAGGTSWAGVELRRRSDAEEISSSFHDWGIPTATALRTVHALGLDGLSLIASGGITDGVMIAKAIALGASLAGAARPLLRALLESGENGLARVFECWKNDVRRVMFLTGTSSMDGLRKAPIVEADRSPSPET